MFKKPDLCRICQCPVADTGVRVDDLDPEKLGSWWVQQERLPKIELDDVADFLESQICQFCLWDARSKGEEMKVEESDWWTGHDTNKFFKKFYYEEKVIQRCSVRIPSKASKRSAQPRRVTQRRKISRPKVRFIKCAHCCKKVVQISSSAYHDLVRRRRKIKNCVCGSCVAQFKKIGNKMESNIYEVHKNFKCHQCSLKFSNILPLLTHIASEHPKMIVNRHFFTCCGEIFNAEGFGFHVFCPSNVQKCPHCPLTFDSDQLLRKHMLHLHKSEAVECHNATVGKYFKSDEERQQHAAQVHENNPATLVQCPSCPRKFRPSSLWKHKKSVHGSTILTKYNCTHCTKKYSHKRRLQTHMKNCHLSKINACIGTASLENLANVADCQSRTDEDHGRKTEMVTESTNMTEPILKPVTKIKKLQTEQRLGPKSAENRHICEHCSKPMRMTELANYVFPYSCLYCKQAVHCLKMKMHHLRTCKIKTRNTDLYEFPKCVYCDKNVNSTKSLHIHVAAEHASKVITCESTSCTHYFKSEADLQSHVANGHVSENKSLFKCLRCSYQVDLPYRIVQHTLVVHSKEDKNRPNTVREPKSSDALRNFAECPTCHWDMEPSALQGHMQICHRKFKCRYRGCGSVFASDRELMHHKSQTHAAFKAFVCLYCKKAFRRRSTMDEHVGVAHESMMIVCKENDCCEHFSKEADFRNHIKENHRDVAIRRGKFELVPKATSESVQNQMPSETVDNHSESPLQNTLVERPKHPEIEILTELPICKHCAKPVKMPEPGNYVSINSCPFCKEVQHCKNMKIQHLRECQIKLKNTDLYEFPKCVYCDKNISSTQSLHVHVATEHASKIITCPNASCTHYFKSEADLQSHIANGHVTESKSLYRCLRCSYQVNYQYRMINHTLVVHSKKDKSRPSTLEEPKSSDALQKFTKCPTCHRDMEPSALQFHMQIYHKILYCSYRGCGAVAASDKELSHHKSQTHAAFKLFVCLYCKKSFRFQSYMDEHVRVAHASMMIVCKENNCSEHFSKEADFRNHLKENHRDVAIVEGKFEIVPVATSESMQNQMPSETLDNHSESPLQNTLAERPKHPELEDSTEMPTCEHCEKPVVTLSKHMIHQTCSFCKVTKLCKDSMALHLRCCPARTRNPFVYEFPTCLYCELMFVSRADLRHHVLRQHDWEMLYCNNCKRTGLDSIARLHLLAKMKKRRNFECEQCDLVTPSINIIQRHVLLMHGPENETYSQPQPSVAQTKSCLHCMKTVDDLKKHLRPELCLCCSVSMPCQSLTEAHWERCPCLKKHIVLLHCIYCEETCDSVTELQGHVEKSHSARAIKCPSEGCHQYFKKEEDIDNHQEHYHAAVSAASLELFKCGQCKFKTESGPEMKKHMLAHKAKMIICKKCFAVLGSNYELQDHLKNVHRDTSVCKHCQRTIKTLYMHSIPSTCKVCSTTMPCKGRMMNHRQECMSKYFIHCTYCKSQFASKDAMLAHVSKTHACRFEGCPELFKNEQDHKIHLIKMHIPAKDQGNGLNLEEESLESLLSKVTTGQLRGELACPHQDIGTKIPGGRIFSDSFYPVNKNTRSTLL